MAAKHDKLATRPEALIFDMDGTLFRTETVVVAAFERAYAKLRDEGRVHGDTPPTDILLGSLGMLLQEIWERVLPDADDETRRLMDDMVLEEQLTMLEEGDGELYPGVENTLRRLRDAGFRLFVASNGLERYVKGVAQHRGIAGLFEGLYSAGEYRTSTKVELVRLLLETGRVGSAWMVGDRSSDVEAGLGNGLPVIGCDYASFGVTADEELREATVRIRRFDELLELLELQ